VNPESKTPEISIIIVNYNAGEHLRPCVESLFSQTLTNFECILIDNGSTDGSLQIALLNPDAFARPDWLENGLNARNILQKTAMVGSTQYLALEPDKFDGLGDEYHAFGIAWRAGFGKPVSKITTREAFGPCGAGAFYDRSVFLALGGFDESFFCYHEDVDLAFRMRLAGYRCVQSAPYACYWPCSTSQRTSLFWPSAYFAKVGSNRHFVEYMTVFLPALKVARPKSNDRRNYQR